MSRIILGIWGYSTDCKGIAHDSGATLVGDSRVVTAFSLVASCPGRDTCAVSWPATVRTA